VGGGSGFEVELVKSAPDLAGFGWLGVAEWMFSRIVAVVGKRGGGGAGPWVERSFLAARMSREGKQNIFANTICQIDALSFWGDCFFEVVVREGDAVGKWFEAAHADEGKVGADLALSVHSIIIAVDVQVEAEGGGRLRATGFQVEDGGGQRTLDEPTLGGQVGQGNDESGVVGW